MRKNYYCNKALAIAVTLIMSVCSLSAQTLTVTVKGSTITAKESGGVEYVGKQRMNKEFYEFTKKDSETNLLYKVLYHVPSKTIIGRFSDKRTTMNIPKGLLETPDGKIQPIIGHHSNRSTREQNWIVYDLKGYKWHKTEKTFHKVVVKDGCIFYQNSAGTRDEWKISLPSGTKTRL